MIIYKKVTMQDLFWQNNIEAILPNGFLMALASPKKLFGREAKVKIISFKSQSPAKGALNFYCCPYKFQVV